MRTRIDVTAEDIAHGLREDGTRCPIALSLSRVLALDPTHEAVDVLYAEIEVAPESTIETWSLDLPTEARSFVVAFDRGGTEAVAPFAFGLDVPDDLLAVVQGEEGASS